MHYVDVSTLNADKHFMNVTLKFSPKIGQNTAQIRSKMAQKAQNFFKKMCTKRVNKNSAKIEKTAT